MHIDLIAIFICLLGSAFFSGSETALSSLPITRLEALRQRCGRLARSGLDRWAKQPEELLITILVGNNLVNVLASALATRIAYRITDSGGLAFVVGVMTIVILVFGEITPKTLAARMPEGFVAGREPGFSQPRHPRLPVKHLFAVRDGDVRVVEMYGESGHGSDICERQSPFMWRMSLSSR